MGWDCHAGPTWETTFRYWDSKYEELIALWDANPPPHPTVMGVASRSAGCLSALGRQINLGVSTHRNPRGEDLGKFLDRSWLKQTRDGQGTARSGLQNTLSCCCCSS
jgi:hypothetical protein